MASSEAYPISECAEPIRCQEPCPHRDTTESMQNTAQLRFRCGMEIFHHRCVRMIYKNPSLFHRGIPILSSGIEW